MPCQLCNSSNHTLRNCNSQIGINIAENAENFILQHKFQINDHVEYLIHLTKPALSFINKKLNLPYNGCKATLVYTIIRKYFRDDTQFDQFRNISALEMWRIHSAYTDFNHRYTLLQTPIHETQMLPMNIRSMIDSFYEARYGIRRYGVPIAMYYVRLNEIARENIDQLSLYERELRQGQSPEQAANREAVSVRQAQHSAQLAAVAQAVASQAEIINPDNYTFNYMFRILLTRLLSIRAPNQNQNPQSHLKKLSFHVETDSSLEQAKECFICSEEAPHAKLGCTHEYCIDCLFGTAKARTKSFICCAVCRAEIDVVQVGTTETKTDLLQKISAV